MNSSRTPNETALSEGDKKEFILKKYIHISEKIFHINLIPPTEKMFKINTVPKCPQKILQLYQAGEKMGINVAGEFEVKTKDKTFSTSIFPFLQTDHLADQLVGKPKTKLCRSYRDKIVFVWHPIII